jgi:FkbM family methyltransferase
MKFPVSIYLTWLRLAWFFRKHFHIKTYGIGWAATKVGVAFGFQFHGAPFRFSPKAAKSYCLLPAGIPNEPETHSFLSGVLEDEATQRVIFVDIGASIGEFAIPMAHDHRVAKVIAFEPHPATAQALRGSANLAPPGKIEIIEMAVGAATGFATFDLHHAAPTAAGLRSSQDQQSLDKVKVSILDEVIQIKPGTPVLLLIDIEGGELDALRGGATIISSTWPLIIFEYNATTRKYFGINQAQQLLGSSYQLFRLRSEDGLLDSDLSSTWNVVALPQQGPWKHLSQNSELFVA